MNERRVDGSQCEVGMDKCRKATSDDVLGVCDFFQKDLRIQSTTERDDETGERLFWSNEFGWVRQGDGEEVYKSRAGVDLPADSVWV